MMLATAIYESLVLFEFTLFEGSKRLDKYLGILVLSKELFLSGL